MTLPPPTNPPEPPAERFAGQVFQVNGAPAPGALIYGLDGSQGALLTRTDNNGRFELDEPPAKLLARAGFSEVEIIEPGSDETNVRIDLVPTEDRPQTIELKNVGMEEGLRIDDGELQVVLVHDGVLYFTVWLEEESRLRLLRSDLETQTTSELYSMFAPRRAVGRLGMQDGLLIFVADGQIAGNRFWQALLFPLESGARSLQLGPFEGAFRDIRTRRSGDMVDVMTLNEISEDEDYWRHTIFELRTGVGLVQAELRGNGSNHSVAGFDGDAFYYCLAGDTVVYRFTEGSPQSLNLPWSVAGCANSLKTDDGFVWLTMRNDNLRFIERDGERQRSLGSLEGLGAQSWVESVSGVDRSALVSGSGFDSDNTEDWVVHVDLQRYQMTDLTAEFGSVGLGYGPPFGRPLWRNGDRLVSRGQTVGSALQVSWRSDGSDFQTDYVFQLPESCGVSAWADGPDQPVEWMVCDDGPDGEFDPSIYEATGLKRSFWSGTTRPQQFNGRLFYKVETGDQTYIASVGLGDLR